MTSTLKKKGSIELVTDSKSAILASNMVQNDSVYGNRNSTLKKGQSYQDDAGDSPLERDKMVFTKQ